MHSSAHITNEDDEFFNVEEGEGKKPGTPLVPVPHTLCSLSSVPQVNRPCGVSGKMLASEPQEDGFEFHRQIFFFGQYQAISS